ncbi:MAG TPA: hypothetical protein VF529_00950 [Solirubrobacteraceae bacterium]
MSAIAATQSAGGAGAETTDLALLHECVIATVVLLLLLCLLERRHVAFWLWGFYSPRKRDSWMTLLLGAAQALLVAALTSLLPALHRAFDIHATTALGNAFLVAEAVTAGAAALAAIRALGSRKESEEQGFEELLQRATRSAANALVERAEDSVPRALRRALDQASTRATLLTNLSHLSAAPIADIIVLNISGSEPPAPVEGPPPGEPPHPPAATPEPTNPNLAAAPESTGRSEAPVGAPAEAEPVVFALTDFIVTNRIPPGRILR